MSVNLLPQHSTHVADAETCDSGKNAGCNYDPEEIPQPAHECSAGELVGQKTPRKRCGADESDKEPDVGGEILDSRAAELIELGENRRPRKRLPMVNLVLFRHLACSM
jgi:hypothetical protein